MSEVDEFVRSAAVAGAEELRANFQFLNALVDEDFIVDLLYRAMSESDITELEERFEEFEDFEDTKRDMQDSLDELRNEYERAVENLNEAISSLSRKSEDFERIDDLISDVEGRVCK